MADAAAIEAVRRQLGELGGPKPAQKLSPLTPTEQAVIQPQKPLQAAALAEDPTARLAEVKPEQVQSEVKDPNVDAVLRVEESWLQEGEETQRKSRWNIVLENLSKIPAEQQATAYRRIIRDTASPKVLTHLAYEVAQREDLQQNHDILRSLDERIEMAPDAIFAVWESIDRRAKDLPEGMHAFRLEESFFLAAKLSDAMAGDRMPNGGEYFREAIDLMRSSIDGGVSASDYLGSIDAALSRIANTPILREGIDAVGSEKFKRGYIPARVLLGVVHLAEAYPQVLETDGAKALIHRTFESNPAECLDGLDLHGRFDMNTLNILAIASDTVSGNPENLKSMLWLMQRALGRERGGLYDRGFNVDEDKRAALEGVTKRIFAELEGATVYSVGEGIDQGKARQTFEDIHRLLSDFVAQNPSMASLAGPFVEREAVASPTYAAYLLRSIAQQDAHAALRIMGELQQKTVTRADGTPIDIVFGRNSVDITVQTLASSIIKARKDITMRGSEAGLSADERARIQDVCTKLGNLASMDKEVAERLLTELNIQQRGVDYADIEALDDLSFALLGCRSLPLERRRVLASGLDGGNVKDGRYTHHLESVIIPADREEASPNGATQAPARA